MIASLATAPASPTAAYSQCLSAARDRLAYVANAPLDTPARVDFGLSNLHTAAASVHDALSGAANVDTTLPSGVMSFPREAATYISRAIEELARSADSRPLDAAAVHSRAQTAIDRLQLAIGLIAHPPSNETFDGS